MPMSPNASSLAIYADYPVSHYTGIPNISVPLYEIDVDGFKLPIKLNYHASGIKVSQEASWVGLGWSLDIGGAISRSVRGEDDFLEYYNPYLTKGYYEDGDISNLDDPRFYDNVVDNNIVTRRKKIDTEPDIFYYSFPGSSGKFIIDKSQGAVLFDKTQNVKIELVQDISLGNNWRTNLCFKLTNVDGTEYYYKRREKTTVYSRPGGLNDNSTDPNRVLDSGIDISSSPSEFTSSWLLDKITTPNKKSILFSYEQESSQSPTQESCEIYDYIGPSSTGLNCGPASREIVSKRMKVRYNSLRLAKVSWSGGHIDFTVSGRQDLAILDASSPCRKLDRFDVFNSFEKKVKSVQFNYSYFNPSYSGEYQYIFKRLKLDNIIIDGDPKNNYLFNYFSGDMLAKNTNNMDYWGYHNGKVYGSNYYTGLVIGNEIYPGANKLGDINFAKIGTLNKITYPTGGNTEFQFESNRFPKNALGTSIPYSSPTREKTIEVYNDYVQGAYVELPTTRSFQFTLLSDNRISIVKNIENTACPSYDQTFSYAHPGYPIGRLRRLSPTAGTIFSYGMPQVNGTNSYCEYIEYSGPHNGTYQPTVLTPGTYVFEALIPPKDVYVKWRLNFISALPEEGENTAPNSLVEGGGLRISKIISGKNIRSFNYAQGELLIPPVLAYTKIFTCRETLENIPYVTNRSVLARLSNSSNSLATIRHGVAVGYDWVEESKSGLGKTKYWFFNDPEDPLYETTAYTESEFPYAPSSIDFKNGLIDKIEYFKGNDIFKTTTFGYDIRYSSIINGFAYNEQFNSTLYYGLKCAWYLKTSEINILKSNNGLEIEEVTKFDYNDNFQLTSQKKLVNSKWKGQKIKYATDFTDAVSLSMVSKYMIGIPVEKIELVDGRVVGAQKSIFFDTVGVILPKRLLRLNTISSLTESEYALHYEKIMEFDKYTQDGKILQMRNKGMLTSFVWGYNGYQPVIRAQNASYQNLEDVLGASNIQAVNTNPSEGTLQGYADMLRSNLKGAWITGYTFEPQIGLSSQSNPRGLKTTYSFDNLYRLAEIKNDNGDIVEAYKYNYRGATMPYTRIDGITPHTERMTCFAADTAVPGRKFSGAFRITLTNTVSGKILKYDIDSSMQRSHTFPVGSYNVALESLDGLSLSGFRFEVWGEPSDNGVVYYINLDDYPNPLDIFIN